MAILPPVYMPGYTSLGIPPLIPADHERAGCVHPTVRCSVTRPWALFFPDSLGRAPESALPALVLFSFVSEDPASFPSQSRD